MDEWYKAAYFDGSSFLDYPAGTDTQTVCAVAGTTANTANCGYAVGDLTAVGSYTGSASPYGTFDQGGNVWEWNVAPITGAVRGGAFNGSFGGDLRAEVQLLLAPEDEFSFVGFRVASIPEPGTGLLLSLGMLGLAGWRRRSA